MVLHDARMLGGESFRPEQCGIFAFHCADLRHYYQICWQKQDDSLAVLYLGAMTAWQLGTMAAWNHGSLAPLLLDTMAAWHHGGLAPWQPGTIAAWHHGSLAAGSLAA